MTHFSYDLGSMQPRTGPDKLAVKFGLASSTLRLVSVPATDVATNCSEAANESGEQRAGETVREDEPDRTNDLKSFHMEKVQATFRCDFRPKGLEDMH